MMRHNRPAFPPLAPPEPYRPHDDSTARLARWLNRAWQTMLALYVLCYVISSAIGHIRH